MVVAVMLTDEPAGFAEHARSQFDVHSVGCAPRNAKPCFIPIHIDTVEMMAMARDASSLQPRPIIWHRIRS